MRMIPDSVLQLSLLPEATRGLKSYHQRRAIPGPALQASAEIKSGERKAKEQEGAVLAFFRANPGGWSPSQVWLRVGPRSMAQWIEHDAEGVACRIHIDPMRDGAPRWPITSIRRAITNLTTSGHLRITMARAMGMFGRLEHLWEVAP